MTLSQEFQPIGQDHPQLLGFLKRAREEDPVFFWEEQGIWVVTNYDDVDTVMSDADHFTAEGNLGVMNEGYCDEAREILSTGIDWINVPQINDTEGKTHARLRTVMQEILSPKRVRDMEPKIKRNVSALIDKFVDRKSCEFVQEFSYPLPVQVIFDLIGFESTDHDLEKLQLWSDDMFRLWLAPLTAEEQVVCARHAVQFQEYIRTLLNERRQSPRDDLLTGFALELAGNNARVSEDEVILMFPMNIIGAGHETTKAALTNALYHMLHVPERWQAIIDDPDTIPNTVEETLRFDGSVLAWYRTVKDGVTLGGKELRPGDKVMAILGSANHDESKFDNPSDFCPMRAKRPKQMTFSTGRHFCLGAPLARLEMQIALEELSIRLPGLRLKKDQPLRYMESVATRVITELHLEWD